MVLLLVINSFVKENIANSEKGELRYASCYYRNRDR
jgi:hypothetical protein